MSRAPNILLVMADQLARRDLVHRAMECNGTSWDYQPFVDARRQYVRRARVASAGADAVLAQRVVEARPQIRRLLARTDDQRARELVRARRKLLRPRPRY